MIRQITCRIGKWEVFWAAWLIFVLQVDFVFLQHLLLLQVLINSIRVIVRRQAVLAPEVLAAVLTCWRFMLRFLWRKRLEWTLTRRQPNPPTEPPEHKNMFFTREKDTHMRQQTLRQWFLTLFTYLTLLSNNITRFTPNTLGGGHLLKIRNSTNSYSLEWFIKIYIGCNLWFSKFTFLDDEIYPQG